jgi:predicted lactoylglutathione lyase
MHQQIFVNLPVKNLPRAMAFFSQLGYTFNPEFTNDQGACMLLGENLHVMLLTETFFASFTSKTVNDPSECCDVIVALSCNSREEVDTMIAKAKVAGASVPKGADDYGFMYNHGFYDPDGHAWELVYMVPNAQCEQSCVQTPANTTT